MEENTDLIPANNNDPVTSTAHKGIPIEQLLELKAKGLHDSQIAKVVGCSKTNVYKRLDEFKEAIQHLPAFKKHKGDLLAVHQSILLKSLTADDLKKVSPYQKVGMFGILYDKERLERDQSTSNVDYRGLMVNISDLHTERARLAKALGLDTTEDISNKEGVD